jgi:uncharacterized BrkB/YihY/UPF0761 family membrane protein
VTALWMASRGIVSLHKGLNRVYSVRETRSGWRRRRARHARSWASCLSSASASATR